MRTRRSPCRKCNIRRYLKHGTLPQLRVFEASARHGSFARAAEELHVAPPTASVQIRKLTETVGLPLLEQIGKRMLSHRRGARLYASCNDIFRVLGTSRALSICAACGPGHLRLAVTSHGASTSCRACSGRSRSAIPGIETSLQIHNREHAPRPAGEERRTTCTCSPTRPRIATSWSRRILPNPLVVLARSDHPLAREKDIPFHALCQRAVPHARTRIGDADRITLKLFEQHGLAPKIRMELSSNEAIREAILAGVGVSILSRYMLGLEAEPTGLACLDVEGFPLESHWHFVYAVGKQLAPAALAFMDFTRSEANSLARGREESRMI